MNDKTFLGEGHYRDNEGVEFMSVWTYKKKNFINPNNTEANGQVALQMQGFNRFKGPYSKSPNYREGWMYDTRELKEFYSK
jgi:hypothetical protein